jgi:glutamyl-tRNA synthetase
MEKIRTRFAPSPTGFLHIGGLRTALFSYLFARHNGGSFILRIEDTDRARLVEGALEDIIDSLKWVGINWDEGPDIGGPAAPYLQSERKNIFYEHALRLVQSENGYKCYCSPDRLALMRDEQKRHGLSIGYDRRCRNFTEQEREEHEKRGEHWVIRLKVPLDGETSFDDLIRGRITKKNEELDDLVLLKSDGFPTYHLANVVDDHLMKISHVIRGDEWISSTPRHVLIYRAFGWDLPQFAHVPVILAQGGGKLSKRHGATMVREFRAKGYLGEALLNFIALLGWALDDRSEFFDMHSLIKHFDIGRVNKASAVFSYEKLDWFNGIYLRKKTTDELFELLLPYLIKDRVVSREKVDHYRDYILQIIPLIQERLKYLDDIGGLIWFFFDERFEIKDKPALIPKKLSREDAIAILNRSAERIESTPSFNESDLESAMRGVVGELGYKAHQVFMTVRVALTGTTVSPGLFETMRVLGKERVLKRFENGMRVLRELKNHTQTL